MSINVVFLAAGKLEDENNHGYPFYFNEKNGKTFIEIIHSLCAGLNYENSIFAFNSNDVARYHLNNFVKGVDLRSKVVSIPEKNAGSAITALVSICELNDESEVLFISANEYVKIDINKVINEFRAKRYDAGVISFKSLHPRYSYVKTNTDHHVVEISQQNPISDQATTGIFWWRSKKILQKCLMDMILKGRTVNSKFYVGMALNEIILDGGTVGLIKIEASDYMPIKTIAQSMEAMK